MNSVYVLYFGQILLHQNSWLEMVTLINIVVATFREYRSKILEGKCSVRKSIILFIVIIF